MTGTKIGDALRPNMRAAALTAAIAASLVFCYSLVFGRLIIVWWNNSVYSHGFLVPFISLYLVWLRRDLLKGLVPSPALPLGLPVLFAGLLLLVAGHAGGISVVQEVSLLVTVSGIVITLLGRAFFKVLWFPIAYLGFMLRFFEILTERLHEPFQNISAGIGTALIHLMGIPAYRETIYIELPEITLEVARVCSGVNYLIAVFAIGIPLAYVTIRSWPRRVLLVSASVLIAILSNGLRVALIGTLAYNNLAGDLHGPYHILQAMFTSFIGFIALFAGAWLLSERSGAERVVPAGYDREKASAQDNGRAASSRFHYILTVIILVAAGGYISLYTPFPVHLNEDLARFPYRVEGWTGFDVRETLGPLKGMVFDDRLSRTYRGPNGEEVSLFIGYYRTQRQGRELVNYVSGELHAGAERVTVEVEKGRTMEINRVMTTNGRGGEAVSFWYDINGRIAAGRYRAKAYTALDSLLGGRSNGAVIVVRSPGGAAGMDSDGSFAANEDFIKVIFPELRNHIPS